MGVQTYYNNYRWGAAAEEDLPKEEENIVLPAKTSLRPTSSSSINGCSWLYHVDEGKTAYAGSEFTIRGFPSVAGMVQPAPIPVTKLFVVPAHLAQCGDIESNPGPKRERPPTKEQIMATKVCNCKKKTN